MKTDIMNGVMKMTSYRVNFFDTTMHELRIN